MAAVGAGEVAHVFHDAQYGDVHELRHAHRLGNYHGDQALRGSDDYYAVYRQALEYCQWYVAGSRRHVDVHVVYIFPDHFGPELLDDARYDGAAPYYGVGIGLKQQVYGHDINAVTAPAGEDVVLAVSQCVLFDAEHPGYGGTGDVRIQYGGIEAPLIGGGGHHGGDKGLAYTTLAAHYAYDLLHPAEFVKLLLGYFAGAAVLLAAAAAIMAAFAHFFAFLPPLLRRVVYAIN